MARYCDAKDLRALIPDTYRDAALADSSGGDEADAGLLAAVLESACNETDALIEGRVRLPLATVPRKLRVAAAYIALELLAIRRNLSLRDETAEKISWWRNWLSKVGEGELRLDAPGPDDASGGGGAGHASSVAVRPAVTGSHGLIFGLLLAFSVFAWVSAETSRAVEARTWAFDVPEAADVFDNPAEMEWAAGESLVLSYAGGSLAEGQTARWEVAAGTNLWLSLEGTGNGWSWTLAPTQSCLPSGRYAGRIAVYGSEGGEVSFQRVAALQSIRVHQGTGGFAQVAPVAVVLTNYATLEWVESVLMERASAEDVRALAEAVNGAGGATNRLAILEAATNAMHLELDGLRGELQGPSWLTPARFTWQVSARSVATTNIGIVEDKNWSVLTRNRVVERTPEWELRPDVIRNQWEAQFEVSTEGPASLESVGDGSYVLSWEAGTATGAVATVTGQLGEWREDMTLAKSSGSIATQELFAAFAPGCIREALAGVLAIWTNSAHGGRRFANYGAAALTNWELRTNGYVLSTHSWAEDCDLSGVSFLNDSAKNWWTTPCTLVASNLVYGAAHWSPGKGCRVAWLGKDGQPRAATIVDQRRMTGDLCLSRIAPPMDTNVVTAYPILDLYEVQKRLDTGNREIADLPPLPVLAMGQGQRAWIMSGGDLWQAGGPRWYGCAVSGIYDYAARAYIRNSRQGAVGGDSGHPCFTTLDGTNLVLIGAYWVSTGISTPGDTWNKPLVLRAAESMGADPEALRFEAWEDWPVYLGPGLKM